ncbi:hypothetical protein QZH41_010412, partial [Actinostola sp. cb2023]
VLLLIAFASLTGYTGNTSDVRFNDRYNFFYFATVTSWLLVIVIFLVFLVRLNRRVNLNWNLVAFGIISTVAFIIDAVFFFMENRTSRAAPPPGAETF